MCQFILCYYKKIHETVWFKRFTSYRSGTGKLLAKKPIYGEERTLVIRYFIVEGCKARTPKPVS